MRITNLEILNFRGIQKASIAFPLDTRIICIIGAGDTTKSTLLKAIEWAFWPSWNLTAFDTDFHHSDTSTPIIIRATVTNVPERFISEDKYGFYMRRPGVDYSEGIDDEPKDDQPQCLTIQLTISQFNPYALLKGLSPYRSVLYVAKWERQQIEFSNQMAGIFQVDEKQDCELLYHFSNLFDSTHGSKLMRKTIEFIEQCATKVNKEVSSYINRLDSASFDFSRIKKHQDFGKLLVELQEKDRHEVVAQICNWFKNKHEFKFYRKELYYEMLRSIDYSRVNNISILDAALKIRKDASLQKRYPQFRCLASRTLLSKGLEFDCVIIDNRTALTAKEFYVAMTRAMKKIYDIATIK